MNQLPLSRSSKRFLSKGLLMTPKSILQMVIIFAGCYLLFILVQATAKTIPVEETVLYKKILSNNNCEQKTTIQVELSICYDQLVLVQETRYQNQLKAKKEQLIKLATLSKRPDALNAFIKANMSFFDYRKAECQLDYQEMMPGSGAGIAYKKCILELTSKRMEQMF